MATVGLNASSTSILLNGTLLRDLAEGSIVEITPVNPQTSRANGTEDSVTIGERVDAKVHDVKIRTMRYGEADVFLNNARNTAGVVVFDGTIKEAYTFNGEPSQESWLVSGGSFTDQPTEIKNNQDVDAVMEYTIQFRTAIRNI